MKDAEREARLERADEPDDRADHSRLGAGRCRSIGEIFKDAAKAWAALRKARHCPAREADRPGRDDGHARGARMIEDHKFCRVIIGAIEDERGPSKELACVRGQDARVDRLDARSACFKQTRSRSDDLLFAKILSRKEDLPLKIRDLDAIIIGDLERYPASREDQRGGRAEPPRSDDEDARSTLHSVKYSERLKYRSPVSGRKVRTRFPSPSSRATSFAMAIFAPALMPTRSPSRRESASFASQASRSLTERISSTSDAS